MYPVKMRLPIQKVVSEFLHYISQPEKLEKHKRLEIWDYVSRAWV